MNKKFSTFLASVLLAGALVGTADAKLKPLATGTAPTIGSSYVLATEFTSADGTVKNNVVISSGSLAVENNTAAELTTFGTEWTLEAKAVTGKENTFVLKSNGKYLYINSTPAAELKDKAEDATAFAYDVTTDAIYTADDRYDLVIVSSPSTAVSAVDRGTAGSVLVKLGTLTADALIAAGGVDAELQASVDKDNYYFIGSATVAGVISKVLKATSAAGADDYSNITPANVDAYLWKVSVQTVAGVYAYTFTNKQHSSLTKTYFTNRAYNSGFNLWSDHALTSSKQLSTSFADGSSATLFGIYKSTESLKSESDLNTILGNGFELTIDTEKDADETIEGISAFEGTLVATDGDDANDAATRFQLKNGKKYIVLDTEAKWGAANVGVNKRGYKFDLMDASDIDAEKQYAWFEFITNAGTVDKKQVNEVRVFASKDATDAIGSLYIITMDGKNYLTTSKAIATGESWPYLYLGSDNIVKVKDLVGKFWTIKYADTRANAKKDEDPYKEEYKYKGILVAQSYAKTDNQADYVPASTVYALAPEAQWGVTGADVTTNKVTLTNRESGEKIKEVVFRKSGDNYIMTAASGSNITQDLVSLEAVEASETDGYAVYTENELKNNNFYLGQYHAIDGNNHAYYVENHAGSHQIGMTAIKEDADKWNLHLATRPVKVDGVDKQVIDTVFVYTELIKLKADGSVDSKTTKTRLAILPYAFQKVGNKEFVTFENKPNYEYYYCDPNNKEEANKAIRFALKMKADGSYNFVEIQNGETEEDKKLDAKDEDNLNKTKVRVANSLNKGSLKTMGLYAEDDNSLMVIEKAESPEYHKITNNVWGDTIQLARANNLDQVIYEQYEAAASELLKDQVSFLNIENVNDPKFDGLNGAIFADTAYINRGENTCWQYLLAVRPSFGYHNENCNIPGHPAIASSDVDTVYGDFLVNLIDTANLYAIDHLHKNPYLIEDKTGEQRAKLSFVPGYHTNDTLYIVRASGDTVKLGMDTPDFNVAKFAFRYVDQDAKSFKIQTQYKEFVQAASEDEIAEAYEGDAIISNEGYLAWENGVLAVMPAIEQGDVFTISEGVKKAPTANDEIAVSEVSVVAVDGAIIVKGAAGKTVAISNILGKTIANTTIASDNETISVPAGIVIVAVDGEEAVKVVVK